MEDKAKLKSITITFGDKDFIMSEAEARALHRELCKLFEPVVTIRREFHSYPQPMLPPPIWDSPGPHYQPPWRPPEIWCGHGPLRLTDAT